MLDGGSWPGPKGNGWGRSSRSCWLGTRSPEALRRSIGLRSGQWGEHGDWAAPVGDLDRLAGLDTPQQLTRPLPEFTHSYCRHVLVVAHGDSLVEGAVGASADGAGVTPPGVAPPPPVAEPMLSTG